MADPWNVRDALDAAAGLGCNEVRRDGQKPCYACRMVARDTILKFLDGAPATGMPPLELRLMLMLQGADA